MNTKLYSARKITFNELLNLSIPSFQREISNERVQYFLDILSGYSEEFDDIYEFPPLLIGQIQQNLYVIDGQHRFLAYKTFCETFDIDQSLVGSFELIINIRHVDNEEELKELFGVVNNHWITPNLNTNVDFMDDITILKNEIKTRFPLFISDAMKPRFPNINLDSFVSFLFKHNIKNIERLLLFNEQIKGHIDPEKYKKIQNKGTLYYSWVYHDTLQEQQQKRSIPPQIRRQLWDTYHQGLLNGTCYTCQCTIDYDHFEAAHVIPRANNGKDTLENLRCTCQTCNRFMGTMNLYEFKNKFYGN